MSNPVNEIICGDALAVLKTLPDNYVQCAITSPPYYCLRSYLPDDHPDKHLEIGLEETPQAFVANLVEVFREVRRVLRPDGVCWINIGDTYANDQKWGGKTSGKHVNAVKGTFPRAKRYTGLPGKNLIGIPWRLAFGLQDDGWILRQDIIWSKPSPMPESVTDRCTKSHEYIFLLTKQPHYYYDAQAIAEPLHPKTLTTYGTQHRAQGNDGLGLVKSDNWGRTVSERKPKLTPDGEIAGANKRSVWTVASQAYSEAHFATMPPKLVEPMILAGSSPRACEHCGAPWKRQTVKEIVANPGGGKKWMQVNTDVGKTSVFKTGVSAYAHTTGWEPTCRCKDNTGSGKCICLDPFSGAGTVSLVALQHSRNYLGIELNETYIQLAMKRIETIQPNLWSAIGEVSA